MATSAEDIAAQLQRAGERIAAQIEEHFQTEFGVKWEGDEDEEDQYEVCDDRTHAEKTARLHGQKVVSRVVIRGPWADAL